jgi:hypothetical protein
MKLTLTYITARSEIIKTQMGNKRLAKISDMIKPSAGKYLQTEGDICLNAYSIGYCNSSSGSFA